MFDHMLIEVFQNEMEINTLIPCEESIACFLEYVFQDMDVGIFCNANNERIRNLQGVKVTWMEENKSDLKF
jgi:hypothetical protein